MCEGMSPARKREADSSGSSVSDSRTDASTPSEGIHRCDTVPPPDGEDDPYSAPTKVGVLTARQLMANAAAEIAGQVDAGPPKSGERPLRPRKPAASEAPVVVAPEVTAIPRLYDDSGFDGDNGDLLDPTSLFGPAQSVATMLLVAPVPTSPPPVLFQQVVSAKNAAEVVQSAQSHDAYLASFTPALRASGTASVVAVLVILSLGLAALYVAFLAA